MQAANTVRGGGISRSVIGFVGALLAAMLLGGAGGFLAKSMSAGPAVTPDSRPVVTHYQSAPAGWGSDSDLTRALPTAAPTYVPGSEYQILP